MRYRLLVLSFAVLAWAVPASPLRAQFGPKHPWLVLDTGGHTAPVSRALFTGDGKELITVSRDKTIRFWDVADGTMLRVLRPPIGPGREGELYAAALSPDGKTLAVAGFGFVHGQGKDKKRSSPVYLIDLEAEEMRKVLPGHEFKVQALAFSGDGKRLASGGLDKVIRVWDVAAGKEKEVAALKGHAGPVTSLALSPDGKRLLSAGGADAPEVWVWSVDKGQPQAKLEGHHKGPVGQVAWGPDGSRLATGGDGDKFVALWDGAGKHLKNLHYTDYPLACQSVAFTHDGKSVVVSGIDAWRCNAFKVDLASGKTLAYVNDNYFEAQNVPAGPAAVSHDGQVVAVYGDRNHRVHLYDGGKGAALGLCGGVLRQPSLVAWVKDKGPDSHTVVWRTRVLPKDYDYGKPLPERFFDRAFDLEKLRPVPVPAEGKDVHFERNRWGLPGLHLESEAGGKGLRLVRNKKPTDVVLSPRDGALVWESVTLAGPDRAAFATSEGHLDLYDISEKGQGKMLGFLGGFNGAVNSVAPSPDGGRYLLGSGEDNVLHVWDTRRPLKDDPAKVHHGRLMSVFVAPPPGAEARAKAADKPKPADKPNKAAADKAKLTADWVAWTPEGYYACSPAGERLMGWHLNNGPDKLATFHPASRFRARFYRPDVIERLLKEGGVEEALKASAKAGDPRAKDAKLVDLTQVLPPNVKVDVSAPKGGKVEITARATPEGKESVSALQLLIDERPWTGKPDKEGPSASDKSAYEAKWTVALAGKHEIRVLARTASSLGSSRGLVRETEPEKVKPQPALYVLAIGIDKYPGRLALKGAVNDATGLEKVLSERSRPLFSKYEAKIVTDEKAKKQGILEGLAWLKERQTPADVAVIFYAGHGDLNNREFYLLPQDANPKDLAMTGLSRAEIKQRVQALPGKVVVVLDACHSGAIGLLFDDVSRELADEDCGVVVICAASPKETAQEKEHGYLTLSMMEGLKGQGPVSKKGECVRLHDLQHYVIDRVEELSDDKQHPTVVVPPWMRSFNLSKPAK